MTIIRSVTQQEVFSHWQKIEKIGNWPGNRTDVVSKVAGFPTSVEWNIATIEKGDVNNLFIISPEFKKYWWSRYTSKIPEVEHK